ncbi:MAG: nucleotidyltransferase family protein [gamma proteobacterium symbiont of Clathrolucina costata]|uniref:Nucleotidyltransferase family protein n=1 Tax=Candidatus Thiodiazotropha taylori TaxID=2792791 RepID=A0A9E4TVT7_9GAMM|nr:nucleotidyltransferase family protein [Candidatus Thiodiazotropha taylori]MCW4238307.1 nucleotidyltransferase family protein [Candidatus Thiodiazotropha endolucinida]
MTEIRGILLAAGAGRRFGGHKLLHPLPSGELVGVAAAHNLVTALPNTLAIVRPDDVRLAERFEALGLSVLENALVEQGMGRSLAIGIGASADAAGWVVALADMPWIAPETIRSVVQALVQGAAIAAPAFQGRRGHPVGFGRQWGDRLQALQGDHGARHLLQAHANELILLPTEDPGVLLDIDQQGDLKGGGATAD